MDELLTLDRLAKKLGVTYRTVYRWYRVGVLSDSKRRVTLRTEKRSYGRVSCDRWHQEFIAAQQD